MTVSEPTEDFGGGELDASATPKKRKSSTSPTARSLAECRKRGWTAQVVERWNSYARIRVDLFGCIDIVAITPTGIMGIQATSGGTGGGHSARRTKILAEPRIRQWRDAGGHFQLWSWSQRGAAGTRKRWSLRVETYAEMLASVPPAEIEPTTTKPASTTDVEARKLRIRAAMDRAPGGAVARADATMVARGAR